MGLKKNLQAIADKVKDQEKHLTTEEATKNILVIPFIQALGYDTTDGKEVSSEYGADAPGWKGKKVDYTILKDEKPRALIECKKFGADLHQKIPKQLWSYFSAVKEARIAILTNGVLYRFYSDFECRHLMDSEPFMEFDLLDIDKDQSVLDKLKYLTKSGFDLDRLLQGGEDFVFKMKIAEVLAAQLHSPDADFVKFLVSKVSPGKRIQKGMSRFMRITQEALNQLVVRELKAAMEYIGKPSDEGGPIRTTLEELEGFGIVKSILRQVVDPNRIYKRDTISYFGILLDDNNKKPICRLHFNNPKKKYVGLLDANKKENRVPIEDLDDIYKYSDKLKETVGFYEKKGG